MGVTVKHAGEAPSEQIIADGKEEFTATDSRGRVLTLRSPGLLDEFRAVEAVGEAAGNATWMSMYMPLLYVAAIDGEHLVPARTKNEADALIQRIGREGYTAVITTITERFKVAETDIQFAKD